MPWRNGVEQEPCSGETGGQRRSKDCAEEANA